MVVSLNTAMFVMVKLVDLSTSSRSLESNRELSSGENCVADLLICRVESIYYVHKSFSYFGPKLTQDKVTTFVQHANILHLVAAFPYFL